MEEAECVGGTHLLLVLGHLGPGHASLSRRSTVPAPIKRHAQHLRSLHSATYCSERKIYCMSLPVWPSLATIHLPAERSFSSYYLLYQTYQCHICLLSSSPTNICTVKLSRYVGSALVCTATTAPLCASFLLHPGYWYPYFFTTIALHGRRLSGHKGGGAGWGGNHFHAWP